MAHYEPNTVLVPNEYGKIIKAVTSPSRSLKNLGCGYNSVLECLHIKHDPLSSNTGTMQNKTNKENSS
jgi:hypothetical protein